MGEEERSQNDTCATRDGSQAYYNNVIQEVEGYHHQDSPLAILMAFPLFSLSLIS